MELAMPRYYAQLDDAGVCIAVTQTPRAIDAPDVVEIGAFDAALVGKKRVGSTWQDAPAAPEPRRVSNKAFRFRFRRPEKVAIEMAALDNPAAPLAQRQQSAALRADLADQAQASYIDLDDPDTAAGVQMLEAAGLLAPGRAAAILSAPVQDSERP